MSSRTTIAKIGSREEWLGAREQLLAREKEHTRLGDELALQRRELPWVRVEKEYRFDSDDGERALDELFDGRSQLLVYHFMFGPSYDAGCPVNSSIADAVDGLLPHLHARDATMFLSSRAPLDKLQEYKRRMGWSIPWVSDGDRGFNRDYGFSSTEEQTREWLERMLESGTAPPIIEHNARATGTDPVSYVAEGFGFTTFVRDDDVVYHTYSTTARGLEFLMGTTRSSTTHRRGATRVRRGSSGSAGTTSTGARDVGRYDNRRQSSSCEVRSGTRCGIGSATTSSSSWRPFRTPTGPILSGGRPLSSAA
jgi:predicted dithiol-disulfide oxidoreductase (DUF899 family)